MAFNSTSISYGDSNYLTQVYHMVILVIVEKYCNKRFEPHDWCLITKVYHMFIFNQDVYTDRTVDIINAHDKENPLFVYLAYQALHFPIQVSNQCITNWSVIKVDK